MGRGMHRGPLLRFLVVDDSPSIRLVLRKILEQEHVGCQVVEAADATAAVDSFTAAPPDIVFLDMVYGSSVAGAEVLAAMLAWKPDAKIVVVTGLPRENPEVVKAISNGAVGYLAKPVRAEEVRRVLSEVAAEAGWRGRIR